jgi:hypothetical protein
MLSISGYNDLNLDKENRIVLRDAGARQNDPLESNRRQTKVDVWETGDEPMGVARGKVKTQLTGQIFKRT